MVKGSMHVNLRIGKLALSSILLASIFCTALPNSSHAAAAPVRLTKAQEIELPVVYYDDYGDETKEKTLFRTDGDYEWRWSVPSARSLIDSGEDIKGISYSDYNSNSYATDAYGQRTWMSEGVQDDGMTKLNSGNYYDVQVDDSASLFLDGLDVNRMVSIQPAQTTVYDSNKNPLFKIQYFVSGYMSPTPLVEDPQGDLIALQKEGIVSYDVTGKRNWVYSDGIVVDETYRLAKSSNVYMMSIDSDGNLFIMTGDHLLTLGLDGQLLKSAAYHPYRYEYEEDSYLDLLMNDDGLVWWDGSFIPLEQAVKGQLEFLDTINQPPVNTTYWAKGSYTNKDTSLVSLDANGKTKWTFKKYTYGVPENIVVDKDGNVFFADARGNIYGLDAKGNEKFHLFRDNANGALTSLTLTPEGDLIGTTSGLGLFCISKRHENLIVDGVPIALGAKPIVKNGTFLVPYRAAFAKLGIKLTADSTKKWSIATSKIGTTLKFRSGDATVYVNGKAKKQAAAPQSISGIDYIPARLIADLLGESIDWDKLRGDARIGSDAQLAEDAVRRYLTYVEHGEEPFANDMLSIKGASFAAKVPGHKKAHGSERWVIDIQDLKSVKISSTEYRIVAKQHNRKYFYSDGPLVDESQTYTYQVKLASDGRWRIAASDFTK